MAVQPAAMDVLKACVCKRSPLALRTTPPEMLQHAPGVNSGALADCQMSQSHTNKPGEGLLNRAKVRPTYTAHLCYWEEVRDSRKKRGRPFVNEADKV